MQDGMFDKWKKNGATLEGDTNVAIANSTAHCPFELPKYNAIVNGHASNVAPWLQKQACKL